MSGIDWKIFIPDGSKINIYLLIKNERAHIHSIKTFSLNYEKELVFRDTGTIDDNCGMNKGEDLSTTKPVIRYSAKMLDKDKKILYSIFSDVSNPGITYTRRTRLIIEKDEQYISAPCSVEIVPNFLDDRIIRSLLKSQNPFITIKINLNEVITDWSPTEWEKTNWAKEEYTRFDLMDI